MSLATIKRRSDFLRARGGARWGTRTLVVEAIPRGTETGASNDCKGARFGFTVTKKLGTAVVRNRARRRLRAAAREAIPLARPGVDYVLIARDGAAERPFTEIKADLAQALSRVHRALDARQRV